VAIGYLRRSPGCPQTPWAVIALLHGLEHGRTYVQRLRERVIAEPVMVDLWAGLDELVALGLLRVEMAVDEEGWPVEPIVELQYGAKLPDPPESGPA
jgi:hypothetical protein